MIAAKILENSINMITIALLVNNITLIDMSKTTINRLDPVEIIHVSSRKISCNGSRDGKSSVFGHPTSYLNMEKDNSVACPYCGRTFKLKQK